MFRKKRIYLDFASGVIGNPSSPHTEGRIQKNILEHARTKLARLVEVKSDDIIFTSSATEANALAILGLAKPETHMLYLPSAHASIVENMKQAKKLGVHIEPLPIIDGRVDTNTLQNMLRPETVLIAMDAVCGETGVIWNTREVRTVLDAMTKKGNSQVFLHVDASQAPFTEKITRSHFGADIMTLDGGKLGARGAGCLIAHRTIPIMPLYLGGGQERGLRSGTENVVAINKFSEALTVVTINRTSFRMRANRTRIKLIELLSSIPNLLVYEGKNQAPHILNISLIGRDTDYLVALLDEVGFAVSTRSACETDSEEGSRAIFALTRDTERARATLRISWGPSTSLRELKKFVKALKGAVAFIDTDSAK